MSMPGAIANALATAEALDDVTTSQRAAILGVPDRLQLLSVQFDIEKAEILASAKWSTDEKARQLSVLRERVDEEIRAVHTAQSEEAHKAIDKREGIARATAQGTLPGYASDATKSLAKLAALGTLRATAEAATTADEALLAVENAELTEDADVVRAVMGAALARAEAAERAIKPDQRLGPGGVAWTSLKLSLVSRVKRFAADHPSPAEVLREAKIAREKLQAHEARQLDAWRELFGIGPLAATRRRFPGWRA